MKSNPKKATTPVKRKVAQEIVKPSGGRLPSGYVRFLEDLKTRIRTAQTKAALSVNRELVALYWHIGKSIVERQRSVGWGASVITRLSRDIQAAFPGIEGFSLSNISRMRAFYLAWTEDVISAQPVPKIPTTNSAQPAPEIDGGRPPDALMCVPWGHNVILLFKLKDPSLRLWYAQKTIEHGWSRAVLTHQIESGLHNRQGKAVTNFNRTLPPPDSDLAQQTVKDPYVFDFLTLADDAKERDLERGLIDHVRQFLLELGVGFAFVGSQYHVEVEGNDYYIDLLFYHLRLRCYVAIDLKEGEFKPEYAGKMNFYLSAVDDLLRHPDDKSSIGMILCRSKNRLIAEYALRDMKKPIGVSEYRLTASLPKELKGSFPTVAELERELGNEK